jgi:prepilin-type N-terminal cleavage/methylation domain-containing protein
MTRYTSHAGYTLIELSVVIALLGIIAGSALHLAARAAERNRIQETHDIMDSVQFALKVYFRQHRVLPCPADPTLAADDNAFGKSVTPCTAAAAQFSPHADSESLQGVIPVKTLGIPLDYAFDGWRQQIRYVIQSDYTVLNPDTTKGPDVSKQDANPEHLTIIDELGNEMQSNIPENGVTYILISHGKDKAGARAESGVLSAPCPAPAQMQIENCDTANPFTFRDAPLNETSNAPAYFDDILRWKSRLNFTG